MDRSSIDQQTPLVTAGSPFGRPSSTPHWRPFLRALADEVDHLAGPGERDDMLRSVGRRMARMLPLPAVNTLAALETEMNDALDNLGWGAVALNLDEADRSLFITHAGLPRIGSLGTPGGQWLSAILEGLYEAWFAQQPGSQPALSALRVPTGDGSAVTLRFGKS